MKFQTAALLCYGALAAALPSQAAGKFNIKVTAPWPTTTSPKQSFYLSNKGDGSAAESAKDAAICSISEGKLTCGDKPVNAPNNGFTDMVKATQNRVEASDVLFETGFSVGADGKLHWADPLFGEKKEALWAFGNDHEIGKEEGKGVYIWANLNCPSHGAHDFHGDLSEGFAEAVPVV